MWNFYVPSFRIYSLVQWLLKILQQVFFIWCVNCLSCSSSQIKYSFITTLSFKPQEQCETTMTQCLGRWALQPNVRMYVRCTAAQMWWCHWASRLYLPESSHCDPVRCQKLLSESHPKWLESSATPLWELQVSYNLEWLYLPSYRRRSQRGLRTSK